MHREKVALGLLGATLSERVSELDIESVRAHLIGGNVLWARDVSCSRGPARLEHAVLLHRILADVAAGAVLGVRPEIGLPQRGLQLLRPELLFKACAEKFNELQNE